MNKMEMCSIFDSKAEAYMQPMFFQAIGQAMRSFTDAVNTPDSEFNKHPEDYGLFHLGSFNSGTGVIEVFAMPVSLAVGNTVKEISE